MIDYNDIMEGEEVWIRMKYHGHHLGAYRVDYERGYGAVVSFCVNKEDIVEHFPTKPRPLKVGDRCSVLFYANPVTIKHIIDDKAWVIDPGNGEAIVGLDKLTKITGEK